MGSGGGWDRWLRFFGRSVTERGPQWLMGVGAFPKPQLKTSAHPDPSPHPVPSLVSEAGASGWGVAGVLLTIPQQRCCEHQWPQSSPPQMASKAFRKCPEVSPWQGQRESRVSGTISMISRPPPPSCSQPGCHPRHVNAAMSLLWLPVGLREDVQALSLASRPCVA